MRPESTTLFLCGDLMTGRGIDQILPHPGDPRLFEPYASSASVYVEIAERANGPIPRGVAPGYIWGDALEELDRIAPDARIVNLETAITARGAAWPDKGIHYRMHPANVGCLAAAGIDCCALANNHVLDWGHEGLADTLEALRSAGIGSAGAGVDAGEASAPTPVASRRGLRVLVFSCASADSGVPASWAARPDRAGVNLLVSLSARGADALAARIGAIARSGDLVVVSIHWGGNWGYAIGDEQRAFARRLVDSGAVHVVHGHSSHHPRAIEVRNERLILYGCGDLINDYEGISGHEQYRPELSLMYFPSFDAASGRLLRVALVPMRIRRFRLERATVADAGWLASVLRREGEALGTRVRIEAGGRMELEWNRRR